MDKGKPKAGKIYALTGGHDTPSISSGNTWAESEVKENGVLGAGTRQTEKNKTGSKRSYKIAVDFDGRREDGEYLDGRRVFADDEEEALNTFIKKFPELKTFEGYCILDEEGEVVN
jgi:hypothetical protein